MYSANERRLRIMKLIMFCLLLSVFHASGSIYSQNTSFNLNYNNITVIEALKMLETNSDYKFLYRSDMIDINRTVNLIGSDKNVEDVLSMIFPDGKATFRFFEDNLVAITTEHFVQQQHTVTGRVTDASTGEPLPGASIVVQGTTIGTTTDFDGEYILNVPGPDVVLVISFIGYVSQEIAVGDNNLINIYLSEDLRLLEEIVVIGYGSMQKQHLTGAVGTVRMEDDMAFRPSAEFGQSIYGQVAGVQVINTSGRPGVSSAIQVRGVNSISAEASPLIVVDGVILPDYDLSNINSSDIESIDILKDAASAAIYGSRGANGVILVTTRSGTPGKPNLTINHSSSIQEVIRRIDVMNAAEYAQATIDAAQNAWIDLGGDPNAPNTLEARGHYKYTWPDPMNNPESLHDTDWHDVVFRLAPMHKTDISLSGGDDNTTYFVSAGIFNQTGIVINTDYQKYSLNLKADSRITDWLSIGGMLNTNIDYENRAGNTSVHTLTAANQYPPVYPIYGEDGYLGGPHNTPGFENHVNILFRTHHGHPYHRGGGGELLDIRRLHTLGNLYGEVAILPGLTFRSSFNAFIRRSEEKYYMNADTGQGPTVLRQARTQVTTGEMLNYTALNHFNYSNRWDAHQLDAVLGYEFTKREFYGFNAQRRDYDNDLVPYLSAGSTVHSANDNAYESALISAFSRVSYNFDGKYMASASFRRDGSSRFGPDHKWGNFPSISAGWRISQEEFMNNLEIISNLNIRASYGFTGNEKIGDYRWVTSMSQARAAFGNNLEMTYYPSSVQNPELRWERTKQQNIGLDLGLFRDRLFIETDFYISVSDDLLLDVPIPSISGFTSVFRNIGEVQNRGIELKITSRNLTGPLSWNSLITFASNENKITALGPDDAPLYYRPGHAMESINMVGHPLFSFYGLQYDGVYMNQAEIDADPAAYPGVNPGDGRYKDINGDGVIDGNDRVIIGNPFPDFVWAFSNSFRFRNFDFSFLFQGAHGMDIFDLNIHRSWQYHEGRNYHRALLNRWRSEDEPGDGYHYKLSVDLAQFDLTPSSYFIQDGSYIRLQEISLGYNLPSTFANRIGMANARVYFNGTNLVLWSKSTVYDPENFGRGAGDPTNIVRRGTNFSDYPSAKVFTLGINVQF